jgi:hypothetical protein
MSGEPQKQVMPQHGSLHPLSLQIKKRTEQHFREEQVRHEVSIHALHAFVCNMPVTASSQKMRC